MRKFSQFMLLLYIAVVVSGCIQTKQQFMLNPNGSGKVIHEAVLQPVDLGFGQEKQLDPAAQMKKIIKKEIEKSEGIDVWKDVTFKRTEDGKIFFQGIAYFPDISNLKIHNNGFKVSFMDISFLKNDNGNLVLEVGEQAEAEEKKEEPTPVELSEEMLAKKIEVERSKYQLQMRPMLGNFLSDIKMEMSFNLPGIVKEFSNFQKDEKGTLWLTFEGSKMLEAMDALIKDDAWLRKQIYSGRDLAKDGPAMDLAMNEKLYGEKAPVRAVSDGLIPLFDYESEVAAARESYAELTDQLGVVETIPVVRDKKETFKSLQVGGVRLVTLSDTEQKARLFNLNRGYTLTLIGELPEAVIKITGGRVERAITDNGMSLLPDKEFKRKIRFPRLSKDKSTVAFDVELRLPDDNANGLKEVSGVLEYLVAESVKDVDLGITEFAPGVKGQNFGAVIKSIKDNSWQKGKQDLSLKLEISKDRVKAVRFYSADGQQLNFSSESHSAYGENVTFFYTFDGKFPQNGQIVVELFEGLKKHQLPFKISNISLIGRALK